MKTDGDILMNYCTRCTCSHEIALHSVCLYLKKNLHGLNSVSFVFQGRTHIFKIHARSMSVERDIRFELLARLCPNSTGKTNAATFTFSEPLNHIAELSYNFILADWLLH